MPARPVDDNISAVPGAWAFDEQVANHFDTHVRKSVPYYDQIQELVIAHSEPFLRRDGGVYDLGTATGETIARLQAAYADRAGLWFVGIDTSEPMLERARARCDAATARFVQRDIAEITPDELIDAALVVATCTIHFLPVEARQATFSTIHDSLRPGGGVILIEKIRAGSTRVQRVWDTAYTAFKRRMGLTDAMIEQKRASLQGVLRPLTLEQNVTLLRTAGFVDVSTFFQWNSFVGLIATKSGTP